MFATREENGEFCVAVRCYKDCRYTDPDA